MENITIRKKWDNYYEEVYFVFIYYKGEIFESKMS